MIGEDKGRIGRGGTRGKMVVEPPLNCCGSSHQRFNVPFLYFSNLSASNFDGALLSTSRRVFGGATTAGSWRTIGPTSKQSLFAPTSLMFLCANRIKIASYYRSSDFPLDLPACRIAVDYVRKRKNETDHFRYVTVTVYVASREQELLR